MQEDNNFNFNSNNNDENKNNNNSYGFNNQYSSSYTPPNYSQNFSNYGSSSKKNSDKRTSIIAILAIAIIIFIVF